METQLSFIMTENELKRRLRFLHPMYDVEKGRGPEDAAVIMLLKIEGGKLFVLFEKRARKAGDRWSGQIAFPGGRFKQVDGTLDKTACREFREETGADVCSSEELIGFMDKVSPMNVPMISVTPFICLTTHQLHFTPNEEVESLFWADILNVHYEEADVRSGVNTLRWRALVYEGNVVWGMTQRIIEGFIQKLIT